MFKSADKRAANKRKYAAVIEISDSSDSEASEWSDSDFEIPKKKQKKIVTSTATSNQQSGRIFDYFELETKTKEAKSAEVLSIRERKEKDTFLANVQRSEASASSSSSVEIVLDYNVLKKEKIVIHRELAKLLKPHQVDGVKHMYNCCYGTVDALIRNPKKGSGCILAHCMGLGKTLQLITLLHTVINYPEFATNRILILCPKSTLSNWKAEINKWIGSIARTRRLKVFEFSDSRSKDKQLDKLTVWSKYKQKCENAACFLMSYESFRSLVFYGQQSKKKKLTNTKTENRKAASVRELVQRCLLDVADLVVCDEGHMIKNLKSITNRAVTLLKTTRRIVLTGTPMQNNLMEYYAMVNFVKPSFLGTAKEFRYIYANPIAKGQHKDSTATETRLMRMQSFNLNRELESLVHRREVSFLMKELPAKYEYVLYIPMSERQVRLYEYYLVENPYIVNSKKLFADYNALRKIWTHPKQLQISYDKAVKRDAGLTATATLKAMSFNYDFEAGDETDRSNADDNQANVNPTTALTRNWWRHSEAGDETDRSNADDNQATVNPTTALTRNWWRPFVTDEDLNSILLSPKFEIMFEILQEADRRNEKCLIFSTSTVCLDIVEYFLKQTSSWRPERDYFRLDGSTKNFQRHRMIVEFNKPENQRLKAFLISAKAGGQGINLTAANRIILMDTSWNPAIDQQSIFRIFRFGQRKNCFIYRLLSMGTMEEKIYSRSVTKQAMSFRVVDKQQIDRHYNMAELAELYTFTRPDMNERQLPIPPKDELLGNLLNKFPNKVFKYLHHESLLDNKHEEEMTEEEKQEAILLHDINKNKPKKGSGPMVNPPAMASTEYNPFDQAFDNALDAQSSGRNLVSLNGLSHSNVYQDMASMSTWNGGTIGNSHQQQNFVLQQPQRKSYPTQSTTNPTMSNWIPTNPKKSNQFTPLLNNWNVAQATPSYQNYNFAQQQQQQQKLNLLNALGSNQPPSASASFYGKRNATESNKGWAKRVKDNWYGDHEE